MSTSVMDGAGHAPAGGAPGGSWPPVPPTDVAASRLVPARRRRNVPYLLAGALLVVVCAVAAVVTAGRLGDRASVLALARPVVAGQVLAPGDIRSVEVAAGAELGLVPATTPGVVGRPVAFSLPAGTLLTRAVLGPAQTPAAGAAVAAVGLKPGQFPPEIEPGARVAVLVAAGSNPAAGAAPAAGTSWTGVVVAVAGSAGEQTTVVSVRMSEADARAMAAAPPGQLSVVLLGGAG